MMNQRWIFSHSLRLQILGLFISSSERLYQRLAFMKKSKLFTFYIFSYPSSILNRYFYAFINLVNCIVFFFYVWRLNLCVTILFFCMSSSWTLISFWICNGEFLKKFVMQEKDFCQSPERLEQEITKWDFQNEL